MPLVPVLSGRRVSPVLPGQTPSNNENSLATWLRKFPWAVLENRRRLAGQLFFLPPQTARSSQASSCLLMVESPKYEKRQAMSYSISTLLTRNLHDVFGENDPARRRAAIDEIFTEDCVFYEPRGVYRGRDEIDRVAGAIKATHP
jgi:hypothetical protein